AVSAVTRTGRVIEHGGSVEIINELTPYERWRQRMSPRPAALAWMRRNVANLPLRPQIGLLTAVEAEADVERLARTLGSLRQQAYPYWELVVACHADLEMVAARRVKQLADTRIALIAVGTGNRAEALYAVWRHAEHELFGLVDPGDELEPGALFEIVY